MPDLTDAENKLIDGVLSRFAKDIQRLGPRRNELAMHAVCSLLAGLMTTEAAPEMGDLINTYLAAASASQDLTHAPQLHLVPIGDLLSDAAKMH